MIGAGGRGDRWAPWTVLGLTLVALLAGWGLRAWVEGRTRVLEDERTGVMLTVPYDWQSASPDVADVVLAARDPRDPNTAVSVAVRDLGGSDVTFAQQSYVFQLGQALTAFRVLDAPEPVQVGVDKGVRFTYAYVSDPGADNPLARGYPVVIAGSSTLIARGGTLYIIAAVTEAAHAGERGPALERIVGGVGLP